MSKIKFRVNNELTEDQVLLSKERLKEFVKNAGGAVAMCESAGIPLGTIKGILGSKGRCASPILINKLTDHFSVSVDVEFTREYLRPDVTKSQWQRLDKLIKKGEQ